MILAMGDASVLRSVYGKLIIGLEHMDGASAPTPRPHPTRPYNGMVVFLDFSQDVMLAFMHENTITIPL
jgi:hypothetical protein